MNWQEFKTKTMEQMDVSKEKSDILDKEKRTSLPVIEKEASAGVKPFEQIRLQEVQAHGFYLGEFGVKGDDVIFHFWPDGYHEAQRKGIRPPNFRAGFEDNLKKALSSSFEPNRCKVELDMDMGAYFVKANGYGLSQFNRKMSIEVCQKLYELMGGKS